MKVCTDSCLFGAWVAGKIESKIFQPKTILDIGSGTGLLSLMLSQKSDEQIDAVEIDENSYLQTKENFLASKWSNRLQAFNEDIKNWNSHSKYDFIISNPPFFENNVKSGNKNKDVAKHDDGLTFQELLQSIKKNLAKDGNFSVLIPFYRSAWFRTLASEYDFYLKEELLVKQTPKHTYFRSILIFDTNPNAFISNELIIKDESGNYTEPFTYLLKDYYL